MEILEDSRCIDLETHCVFNGFIYMWIINAYWFVLHFQYVNIICAREGGLPPLTILHLGYSNLAPLVPSRLR